MSRSLIVVAVPVLIMLGLGACASSGKPVETYGVALDRVTAECQARQGILQPSGRQTGRPEEDYACRIVGASRLTRSE